jgi:hypothetical protein
MEEIFSEGKGTSMIPTEVAERILVEVNQNKPPARDDSPEEAAFRAKLEQQCAEIKAQGYIVDIPSEINVGDEEDYKTPVQTDETAPTDDDEAESAETPTEEAEPATDDIDDAVNELTKRKPM